jgi:dihydrofolate synthase / folylpolyglutamate synthase
MSYTQLLRQLFKINMYNPLKTGLDNMNQINKLLGSPLQGIPIVHVTGTNGKGSVAFKIARALTASGIRTGLFTSPHISTFKERIQVNHDLITEEDVEVSIECLWIVTCY